MKKSLLLVIFLFVIFIGLTYFVDKDANIVSYVKVSINPEVQLALDTDNKVVEILPLNEDADILVQDLKLVGKPVNEAVDILLDESITTGFIKEYDEDNGIIVEVVNDDDEKRGALEEGVMANLKARLEQKRVFAVLAAVKLGDQLVTQAEAYGISVGKMMLVEQALILNPTLVKDELVLKTVQEIQSYIKEVMKARQEALKLEREELKEKKEALKEEHRIEVEAIKEQAKANIRNYQDLEETEKTEAVRAELEKMRELKEENFERIQEKAKAYIEEGNYNSIGKETVEAIREIIRRKGN